MPVFFIQLKYLINVRRFKKYLTFFMFAQVQNSLFEVTSVHVHLHISIEKTTGPGNLFFSKNSRKLYKKNYFLFLIFVQKTK